MYRRFRDLIFFASGIEVSVALLAAAGLYAVKTYCNSNIHITITKDEQV